MIIILDFSAYFYPKFITLTYTVEMLRMEVLAGLKAPVLYLYVLSVLYDDFKIKIKYLLFFVPLSITLVVLIPDFFNVSARKQALFFQNFYDQPEAVFITFFAYIVGYVFLFAGLYQIKRYQKIVKQNYSNLNALVNCVWLKQFLIIIIIGTTITLIKNMYQLSYDDIEITNNLRILFLLFAIVFASWLFSKALLAPKTFQGINASLLPIKGKANKIEDENVKRIELFMKEKESYLDPSLTLRKLGVQLNIPPRELSILINQHIGKHFFDFVNEYRVKKAMETLRNTSLQKKTIQEIMYDVGFNSKNSFNTAFKKHTNLTPTQYKKNAGSQLFE
ncbi:helix-turn-helix domain-containing protein [Aquimarina aquimarini]|nr:helix-turn-helix domain-containing protein [Aquimarina aquimarini]